MLEKIKNLKWQFQLTLLVGVAALLYMCVWYFVTSPVRAEVAAEGALVLFGERDVDVGLTVGDDSTAIENIECALYCFELILWFRRSRGHVMITAFLYRSGRDHYMPVLHVLLLDDIQD